MNDQLRLLAVCNYPSDTQPTHQVFVRALLRAMTSLGVDITVLAPESRWNLLKGSTGHHLAPRSESRDGIPIRRPRYLTFSALPLPVGGTTLRWNVASHARAVSSEARRLPDAFNVCLGHFLYPHGLAAVAAADALGIPAVVSLGESTFGRYETTFGQPEISRLLGRFAAVIANSPILKERCVERYGIPADKISVFPNGVNEQCFHPWPRAEARERCQLPASRPIVVFVGQFVERKGPLRVMEAIRTYPEIGAVFLGDGPQVPKGPQVLHCGPVPHEDVPVWLSAGDLFVMPTLDEGCSNAILEALSCGLPVVSSDLPFNHAIFHGREEAAVLVNPRDVSSIGQSIRRLMDGPEQRASMSQAALDLSQSYRLTNRAKRIIALLRTLS